MALSPSERVMLIKEIAGRLGLESYMLIDVTLKQFGLPRSDSWGGTPTEYVLAMVSDASDSALTDLALHVGVEIDPAANNQGIDPPFWRKGMLRVFITHLAVRRAAAAELQEALLLYGISGFVAHSDIEPTQEWQTQIETALATCDALVSLLHPDFHKSNWTDQEIGFAMGRGVPVFSVRFGQDPYGFIGRFQAFNGKPAAALARELFDTFRENKQTQRRMAEVLVGLFEESGSFVQAKARIAYLEAISKWEPSFATRILAAVENNGQVRNSFGVPERVEALVKKWEKGAA